MKLNDFNVYYGNELVSDPDVQDLVTGCIGNEYHGNTFYGFPPARDVSFKDEKLTWRLEHPDSLIENRAKKPDLYEVKLDDNGEERVGSISVYRWLVGEGSAHLVTSSLRQALLRLPINAEFHDNGTYYRIQLRDIRVYPPERAEVVVMLKPLGVER
ncbi:hypothetical protein [Pseudomonas sp. 210_17 TE3656]